MIWLCTQKTLGNLQKNFKISINKWIQQRHRIQGQCTKISYISISNEWQKIKTLNATYDSIKNNKIFRINLTKNIRGFYSENLKKYGIEIREDSNRYLHHADRLRNSSLLLIFSKLISGFNAITTEILASISTEIISSF